MKICPECHTRFDGNEAFCPNDGNALVEARELSPGALTGTTIGKQVILERLMWSDDFAERYSGRTASNKTEVHVTVIQPGIEFASDAAERIEATRAKVGSPLPEEIATLLKTELDHVPSFVIQTAPRGPSLREVLDERERLDWETAAKIVCRVGRASQWLLDQGVVHWALHPGSLHVVKLNEGAVQLGEWFFDSLMGGRSPDARIKGGEPFPGYIGTMAPEVAAGDDADERSVVFALGALFFELVTGKPPFAGATAQDTLERLQTESAVKLSIARGGGELHPELDDVIELMLAKEPGRRLQKPMAAIAVLSNILGSSPGEVAPEIERSEEAYDELYATTEMSSFDRKDVTATDDSDEEKEDAPSGSAKDTLLMGAPLVKPRGSGISGESSTASPEVEKPDSVEKSVDAEKPGDVEKSDDVEKSGDAEETNDAEIPEDVDEEMTAPGAPVTDEVPDTEPVERSTKETLMMGRIGPLVEEAERAHEEREEEAAESSDDEEPSLASSAISGDSSTSDPRDPEPTPKASVQADESIETESQKEEPTPASQKETLILDDGEDVAERLGKEAKEADDSDAAEAEDVDEAGEDEDDVIDPEDTQKLDLATGEVEAADDSDASSEDESDSDDEDEANGIVVPPAADEWFAGTDESLWEQSFAEEHAEASEKRWKAVLFAALGLVVLAAIVLFVYSQYIYEPEGPDDLVEGFAEEVVEEVDEVVPEEEPATTVDLPRIRDRFDSAMKGGRLITPPQNSAARALEMLLEHDADSAQTKEATDAFVAAARSQATDAQTSGDLRRARLLLVKATTFAPEDAELQAQFEEVDASYRGSIGSLDGSDAGMASDETADAGEAETSTVAATEQPEVVSPKQPTVEKKPDPKPEPKPQPKNEKVDVSKLIRDARSAYSRGDLSTSESLYKKALDSDSRNHVVNAGLGQVYFDQGAYSRAVRHQMQAVRSKPDRVEYRINLGQSYYRLGKYRDAIQSWEAALARDPGNANAKRYIQLAEGKLN